jgi:hypothetical protein
LYDTPIVGTSLIGAGILAASGLESLRDGLLGSLALFVCALLLLATRRFHQKKSSTSERDAPERQITS